jgi:hypothetical protein
MAGLSRRFSGKSLIKPENERTDKESLIFLSVHRSPPKQGRLRIGQIYFFPQRNGRWREFRYKVMVSLFGGRLPGQVPFRIRTGNHVTTKLQAKQN